MNGNRRIETDDSVRQVQIAASLICTDLCNLEQSVRTLEECKVDALHVDLLDGHFSPSMPIGIDVVRQLRDRTALPFDVHLMVENNEFFLRELAAVGVQRICFHQESAFHLDRLVDMVKDKGIQAGVALSPATPLWTLEFIIEKLDYILLMLINPGYAGHQGQKQVPYGMRKVRACQTFIEEQGRNIPIEVDGRVSFQSIPELVRMGADILVAGSSCLFSHSGSLSDNMSMMKAVIDLGLINRKEDKS